MSLRADLEKAFEALYDYEYINLEKFYNDKGYYELISKFEDGDDSILEELKEQLQGFLDFETNYNLTIEDILA